MAKFAGRFTTMAAIALAASIVCSPWSGTMAQQNFPDPADEAKLYEAAKKEGTVVWYGTAPLEAMQGMAEEFQKKYSGVRVEIQRIVGLAQYQRVMRETEAHQYIADIIHISDRPSVADLVERGYIANWRVPTFDRLPPEARMKTHAYTSYLGDADVAYNPNKVTPEEAKILASSWKGILDPRFKGRIAVSNQVYSYIVMFLDPRNKDVYGVDFLKALAAQKPVVYSDVITSVDRVIAGEQDIVFPSAEGLNYVKWQQGAPIRWVHPKPTPSFNNSWFGVYQFAPHPNAARLYLNWLMSEDGERAVQARFGAITTMIGYPDQRPVAKEPWYDPITEKYVPDWDRWSANIESDMALWNKILKDSQ